MNVKINDNVFTSIIVLVSIAESLLTMSVNNAMNSHHEYKHINDTFLLLIKINVNFIYEKYSGHL